MPLRAAWFLPHAQRGGVAGFRLKVWRSRFPLYASFRCESACTLPTREKGGGRERPPPKAGGHVTPIAVLSGIPLSGPMGSLSSSFIPAGRLRIEAESRCLLVETPPLSPRASSCRIGPRRQGFASPLRALDGSGPIREMRCSRGKRGVRAVWCGGLVASPLVHDKGYYHSVDHRCLSVNRRGA